MQAAAERDSEEQPHESWAQHNGASQSSAESSNGAGRSGGFGELGPIALSFAEDQHIRFGRCEDVTCSNAFQPTSKQTASASVKHHVSLP